MNNNRIFTLTILVNLICKGALTNKLGFDSFFFVILFCITKPCTSSFCKTYQDVWKLRQKNLIYHYPVCIFIPTDLLFGSSRADKWCAWTSCPASRKTDRKIWCKNFFGFLCWPSTPLSRAVTKKGLGTWGQGFPLATISITPGYILRKLEKSKVEPLLSGHLRGTSKWRLNRGWPLSRGSSEIIIIFSRNITLFWNKHATGEAVLIYSRSSTSISDCIFLLTFLKWSQFKCIKRLMAG